jgi:hypothetical protein
MDELAGAAGANPYEFRRALLARKPRHKRVLETAAERAGWGQAPSGHFQGIALMEGYTTCVAQVAEISVQGGELKVHKIVCALDCGQTVNPRIIESQIQSGIVLGLSSALWGDVTIAGGAVQQTNFNSYRVQRRAGSARPPSPWWPLRSATRSSRPPASVCGDCRSLRTAASKRKDSGMRSNRHPVVSRCRMSA